MTTYGSLEGPAVRCDKLKIYYAHCIALYNTPQEDRDIHLLQALGFEVVNPNNEKCTEGYKQHGMGYFAKFAQECDAIAFRALPDGVVPAGVAKEIGYFWSENKPVIELPSCITRRTISVEQTREYLREVGQR